MTKEESLYQVKLILDNIPENEYKKIPKNILEYIQNNMEYNENIKVNTSVPLENQDIDEKTYVFLNKVINEVEKNEQNKQDNKNRELQSDNQKDNQKELIEILDKIKNENEKMKLKLNEYKTEIDKKTKEIDELKSINQELYSNIQRCPKLFRRLFFKNIEKKLLK